MNAINETHVNTLVCLLSLDDDAADRSALQLAKLFGSSCRALLIEDRDWATPSELKQTSERVTARRRRRLTVLGREIGLNVDVDMSELSPSVQHLRSLPDQAMTILMQPAHPLSRQTHTFQSIQAAVASAAGATLYAPPLSDLERGAILVLAAAHDSASLSIAERLSRDTHRALDVFRMNVGPQPSVAALVEALTLRMSPDAPSLIVMAQGELLSAPSMFSSLAARLGTPVLVVGTADRRTSNVGAPRLES